MNNINNTNELILCKASLKKLIQQQQQQQLNLFNITEKIKKQHNIDNKNDFILCKNSLKGLKKLQLQQQWILLNITEKIKHKQIIEANHMFYSCNKTNFVYDYDMICKIGNHCNIKIVCECCSHIDIQYICDTLKVSHKIKKCVGCFCCIRYTHNHPYKLK
jgi:hypothetical protein